MNVRVKKTEVIKNSDKHVVCTIKELENNANLLEIQKGDNTTKILFDDQGKYHVFNEKKRKAS